MSEAKFERHPGNPIFPKVAGTWRGALTANVDVLQYNDEWRLYIRGNTGDEGGHASAYIGLFTCPVDRFDGFTWLEYPGNPVLRPGQPGSIDDLGAIDPNVIVADEKFLMYYVAIPHERTLPAGSAKSGRGVTWGHAVKVVALATSDDGLNFKRYGDESLLPPFSSGPEIVVHDNIYWLYYSAENEFGGTDIYLVRSEDPYHFDPTSRKKVFAPGQAGTWDCKSVNTQRIFQDNGIWYMFYTGSAAHEDTPWNFGVAASRDLVNWTRYDGNPVFERGTEGQWDDCGIWYPTTVKVGDTYYMWYEGRSCGEPQAVADIRPGGRGRGGFSQVGLATMKSDTFFFTI